MMYGTGIPLLTPLQLDGPQGASGYGVYTQRIDGVYVAHMRLTSCLCSVYIYIYTAYMFALYTL